MRTAIVTIEHDPDVESPLEYDSWVLHSFCSRHSNYKHPSELGLGELGADGQPTILSLGLKRKLEVGTAFILSYYEHGEGCWSLQGEGTQCRFDTARVAGLLVWEGKPKDCGWMSPGPDGKPSKFPGGRGKFEKTLEARAKNARATLKVYNEWCNGHCYSFSIKEYDEEEMEEGEEIDGCSGYIGDDVVAAIKNSADDNDLRIVKSDGVASFMFYVPYSPAPTKEEVLEKGEVPA